MSQEPDYLALWKDGADLFEALSYLAGEIGEMAGDGARIDDPRPDLRERILKAARQVDSLVQESRFREAMLGKGDDLIWDARGLSPERGYANAVGFVVAAVEYLLLEMTHGRGERFANYWQEKGNEFYALTNRLEGALEELEGTPAVKEELLRRGRRDTQPGTPAEPAATAVEPTARKARREDTQDGRRVVQPAGQAAIGAEPGSHPSWPPADCRPEQDRWIMADRSLAVPRLGLLLAKIRDELRQFLDAFQCAISGKGNVNWHGFCLEVPDPGNGGTISFSEETPHVNLSNFAIYRFNIPVSETDIDTAAGCLEDFDLPHDAKRLRDEFQDLKHAFCSLGDWVQHSNGVVTDRKFHAQACAAALWEHVNQLIGTVEAVSPPADVAALATGSFFTPGSPKSPEDRPPPDPEHSDEESKPRWDNEAATDLKANPRPAFHGDQPALSPRMEAKVRKAMEFIDKKGKVKGLSIAKEINVEESTFRKHYVPILEKRGIRNDGDGYYRPKEGDKA